VPLPADSLEGLQAWYRFRDIAHFVEIYDRVSRCIQTPDDIELIAREFLAQQAAQNIWYSEVTLTPYTHYRLKGLTFAQQLVALNRARVWAEAELGVTMRYILDFARRAPLEQAATVADWAVAARDEGVVALGLGGVEQGHMASRFRPMFERVRDAGLARVPHAGETVGPESIWDALRAADATRIGHGVRCMEDPTLVDELRRRQIPLEICPTSNVCLGVARRLADHPLPRLLEAGLYVTVNSDDPPMFDTTLTGEYLALAQTFGFGSGVVERLTLNALRATLLATQERVALEARFSAVFMDLRARFA
jgi:adenosine deaminase